MKKRFQPNRNGARNRGGFTLIEILAALTVLTLMLVMVGQLVNSAAAVMTMSGRQLDADTQARMIFNRMEIDISRMMKRTDVDYSSFKNSTSSNPQVGNDQLAFYSETHGYYSGTTQPVGTGKADLSLVAYVVAMDPTTNTPVLQRLGKGLGWEPDSVGAPSWNNVAYLPITLTSGTNARWPNLFNTSSLDPDYRSVGNLVFRMEYTYLLKATATQPAKLSITPYTSPDTSLSGFKDVAALVVTIAMLDNTGRAVVTNYSNLTSSTIFTDAVNVTTPASGITPTSAWNAAVNSPSFATTAGIPKAAATTIHVYERYFYLDSPF